MKMKTGRHIWYLFLAIGLSVGSVSYLLLTSPFNPDGSLDRPVVFGAMVLLALTATAAGRFLTHFFWSRRRAGWVGVFLGFASLQVLTLSSLRLMEGIVLVLLFLFNGVLFWYMIRLVRD